MTALRILIGTTASGKERLALEVAKLIGGEIVSVDSMKVYRGLDVATAKAGAEERRLAPHHCLDLVGPEEAFSAADFVREAEAAVAGIVARGKIPVLSGGTAFYYKALLEGLFEGPGADLDLRRRLEERAAAEGSDALHRELAARDPAAAAKIHPADLRRLVRALEVAELTGKSISASQTQWAEFHNEDPAERAAAFFAQPRHPFVMARIVRERDDVRARVKERIGRMAERGLKEEAERVFAMRDTLSRTPLQAVGYKEFFPYFAGECSWEESLEKLRLATNKLVRSQDTWFRKFPATPVAMDAGTDVRETAEMLANTFFAP
jgi:tRNA dimethylallyltransferase